MSRKRTEAAAAPRASRPTKPPRAAARRGAPATRASKSARAGGARARARPAAAAREHGLPAATLFAALGDATRLRLLHRLGAGEALSIARLSDQAKITRQAITKHLRVLEGAGLLQATRVGRERFWLLERARLDEAQRALARISEQWDEALARLKDLVEEPG